MYNKHTEDQEQGADIPVHKRLSFIHVHAH